jgi:tetratricopeptide (TPR) repeat protein
MSVLRTALLSIAIAGAVQAPLQQDVKARITEASDLLVKRSFADAMKIIDALAADPTVAADPVLQSDVTYLTGNAWFLQNDYPKAVQFLERSLEICRGRADQTCQVRALFRLTQTRKNMGQYSVALERGQELVALSEGLKNDDRTARSLGISRPRSSAIAGRCSWRQPARRRWSRPRS